MAATGTTPRRNVSGYSRKDGTHVRSYSQRYHPGEARAVAGGLAVAVLASVMMMFNLFTAVLELIVAIAGLAAVIMLGRAEVRRRKMRANRRRSRGRYMAVQWWRSRRAKRPPAKKRARSTSSGGRRRSAAPWGRRAGPWAKRGGPWKSRAGHRVNQSGSFVKGPGGRWVKVAEGSSRRVER